MTTLAELLVKVGIDASEIEKGAGRAGKAALAAGAAVGAAMSVAVAEAINVEAATDKLAAQLGATPAEARRLGGIAGDLYAGAWGDSLEEVNVALRGVVQNVAGMADASDAELRTITASVLDVGKTFEQDLGQVTRSVGKLMKTGLAPDAQSALDIITRGFQTGGDEAGDLLETVNEYSTMFREVGLSGKQMMGLISQGLDAGARDADKVADAIKEFAIRAKDGTDLTAEGFRMIGLDAGQMAADVAAGGDRSAAALDATLDALRNMEDPVLRDQAAVALFGTQAEDLGDALFALDPSEAVSTLGQVTGAAQRMGDTLNDNAQTNITSFMRQAKLVLVDLLGNSVLPAVTAVASVLAANFGPALGFVAGIVTGTVLPALAAMAGFIADNRVPIMIVAGLIAAVFIPHLVALGVAATVARARVVAAWVAKQAAAVAAAAVHSVQVARMVAGWALLGVQSLLHAAKVAAAWLIAMGPIGLVIAVVVGLVALVIANWDKIKKAIAAGWQFVKNITSTVWNAVRGFLVGVWNAIRGAVSSAINTVRSVISGAWNAVRSATSSAWNAIRSAVVSAASGLLSFVQSIPGRIVGFFAALPGRLFDVGRRIIQRLIDGVKSMIGAIGDAVGSVVSKVTDLWPFSPAKEGPLRRFPPELAGENIGRLFAEGLRQAERDVVAAAEAITRNAVMAPGTPDIPALHRFGGDGRGGLGLHVEHLEVKAFSDRFSIRQVMDDLAMHGVS
ncbi:MAG: phage tail tape measure protein [Acidimicrobiales bacterium]